MSKKTLEDFCSEIREQLDWVEDAWVDDDCAYEGGLSIQVRIKEDRINEIAESYGYDMGEEDE